MKFLVISRMREMPPVPPEQQMELVIDTMQTLQQLMKEGKAEVSYGFAGLSAGMAIFNAESGAVSQTLFRRA